MFIYLYQKKEKSPTVYFNGYFLILWTQLSLGCDIIYYCKSIYYYFGVIGIFKRVFLGHLLR